MPSVTMSREDSSLSRSTLQGCLTLFGFRATAAPARVVLTRGSLHHARQCIQEVPVACAFQVQQGEEVLLQLSRPWRMPAGVQAPVFGFQVGQRLHLHRGSNALVRKTKPIAVSLEGAGAFRPLPLAIWRSYSRGRTRLMSPARDYHQGFRGGHFLFRMMGLSSMI